MNGQYNRPLTLTDFLYLIVLFFGVNLLYTASCWETYVFFAVISLSLIVDWTSAFTLSNKASPLFLLADIVTVVNYLCLYQRLFSIVSSNAESYVGFFFHYGAVFTIYFIWNILLLKSNKSTQKTVSFITIFTIIDIVFAVGCFIVAFLCSHHYLKDVRCLLASWIIAVVHFLILFFWLKGTFLNKNG